MQIPVCWSMKTVPISWNASFALCCQGTSKCLEPQADALLFLLRRGAGICNSSECNTRVWVCDRSDSDATSGSDCNSKFGPASSFKPNITKHNVCTSHGSGGNSAFHHSHQPVSSCFTTCLVHKKAVAELVGQPAVQCFGGPPAGRSPPLYTAADRLSLTVPLQPVSKWQRQHL